MFTSRGPRNPEEIAACVSFFQNSPHKTASLLTESEMVNCWQQLLESGLGVIDIVESERLTKYLKNSQKADDDPHYKHGFVHVAFGCYITFEIAREILTRTDDRTDAMIYLLEQQHAFQAKISRRRPTPTLDEEGRVGEESLYLLTSGVYHSDIASHLSLQTPLYYSYRSEFADRAFNSLKQMTAGFRHAAHIHTAVGEYLISPYQQIGLNLAQKYSGNPKKSRMTKKFLFWIAKDDEVSIKLGLAHLLRKSKRIKLPRYQFMFLGDSVVRRTGLSEHQQHVAVLSLNGFSTDQIASRLYDPEFSNLVKKVDHLKEKRKLEVLDTDEQEFLTLHRKRIQRIHKAIYNVNWEVCNKLHAKGLFSPPYDRELLAKALESDTEVAHEVREFFFPLYPWPDDFVSRK